MARSEKQHTVLPWLVWGCAGLFYFYQFILRASPNVIADHLMRDFSIDACHFGIFAACYYYTYSLLQIPVGLMLDRVGPKRVLRVGVILCAFGALVFSFATDLWTAGLARTLIGAGAATAFLGTVRLTTLWFPAARVAFIVGLTIALGKLGGMSASYPLAVLVEAFSWKQAILILSIAGFGIGVLIWLFVKDGPWDKFPPRPSEDQRSLWVEAKTSLGSILKNRSIWWIALYGCLTYVPLSAFTDVWGTSFLMRLFDLQKTKASALIILIFVGMGLGAPATAAFSDWIRKRHAPMLISAVTSLLVNSALIFMPGLSVEVAAVLLFLIGFCMTGQTLVFIVSSEVTPSHLSGTVTGFINTIVMLGGVFLQPLVGWLLDWAWSGQMQNGVRFYSVSDFRLALSVIPLCMLLAVIVVAFVPETHPKRRNRQSNKVTSEHER